MPEDAMPQSAKPDNNSNAATPAPGQAANRRIFSRIGWLSEGRLAWPGGKAVVDILDLSLTGAKVRLPEGGPAVPAVGSLVDLHIRLAGDDGAKAGDAEGEAPQALAMSARIVHHHPGTRDYGLNWTEIDLDSLSHLRRLVELNLGDAKRLHQELEHLVHL
jgi:hypothetical protein